MSDVRSIFIESHLPYVPGQRIAMRVQGKGDPMLLINGMTRPIESWDTLTARLPGRTFISFDAPGVGASPTSVGPVSIAKLARLAAAVLEAAGFEAADVLGFSHGGAVAQQLAYETPAKVRRLILASTSCGVGATPGRTRDIPRSLGRPLNGTTWPVPDPFGLLWQSLAVSSWSSIPFLGAIQVPTLVVCGSRDRVVPPCNSRVLARRIPGASLVMLSERGHDLQRGETAKALATVVDGFLPATRVTEGLRACG
jgi:pimeloyl-ACP methyl ester carboxylesterase